MGEGRSKLKLILYVAILLIILVVVVVRFLKLDVVDIESTGDELEEELDIYEEESDRLADEVAKGLSGLLTKTEIDNLKEYIVDSYKLDLIYLNYGRVGVEDNGDIDVTSIYERTIEHFNETDEMDERLYEKDGRWYMPRDLVDFSEEEDILVWYKGQGIFISEGDLSGGLPEHRVRYSFDEKFEVGGENKYYYTGSDGSRITIWIEYLGDNKYGLELDGVVFEITDEYKILE